MNRRKSNLSEYQIEFVQSAAKELRALPKEVQRRIATAVDALREMPRPHGVVKLKGHQRLYRLRVGRYRIVYEIDDEAKLIRITRVRHRSEAYE